MKRQYPNPNDEQLDKLVKLLIKSEGNDNDFPPANPYLFNRIQLNIKSQQLNNSNNWLIANIVATRNWLLAVTAIALLIFGGSFWMTTIEDKTISVNRESVAADEIISAESLDDQLALTDSRK